MKPITKKQYGNTSNFTHMETINGITFIDEGQIKEIKQKGEDFYEQWMLKCIKDLGYMSGVWLDIGAHVGNHTIWFSNHCGADEVWAYEPTPYTFDVLKDNVERNCTNVVRLFNCAVGAKKGKCRLKKGEREGQNSVTYAKGSTPMEIIGDIAAKVALVKIDVEGFELEVLKGAQPMLSRDLPELFIESFGDRSEIEALLPKEYKLIKQYNSAPTYHYSAK